MASRVPAERAEQVVTGFLTELLGSSPDWLRKVYQRTRELVQETAARLPEQQQQVQKHLAEVQRQIANLVAALADGTLTSTAVRERLTDLEAQAQQLKGQLASYETFHHGEVDLPDNAWLAERLRQWITLLNGETPRAAALLRQTISSVAAYPVIAPGKKRGYTQLRFCIQAWKMLRAALGTQLAEGLPLPVSPGGDAQALSPEFVLDLGEPTAMDRWAPRIANWRAEGVTWEEIVRRTGLDLNRAFVAWKRYTRTSEQGQA
jgi:hypothetical protein